MAVAAFLWLSCVIVHHVIKNSPAFCMSYNAKVGETGICCFAIVGYVGIISAAHF